MSNGIPDLLVKASNVFNSASMALSGAYSILGFGVPIWGIYLKNKPVIIPDTIAAFDFKKDFVISDYPQEAGNFQSYNKVETPFNARVRMTKGGTVIDRAEFLSVIDKLSKSLDLYDIVTPERTYTSANIIHYDFERQADKGSGLLSVDIWLEEVRVTVYSASNTAKPDGAKPVQGGSAQTYPLASPAPLTKAIAI